VWRGWECTLLTARRAWTWLCMPEHHCNYTGWTARCQGSVMQVWELVSIAARLGSWTNVELWNVVWFLYRQGWTLTNIHRELLSVFGIVMTRTQISMCCRAFKNGRVLWTNELQRGMPRALTPSDSMSCGKPCTWDRCVKIHQIAAQLNMLPTRMHEIVHDTSGYGKVAKRCVPGK